MKGDVWIGHKFVDYYYEICGRKYGYISNAERMAARKRNRKKRH